MDKESKHINLKYLECNLGGLHEGEQITYVCVDPKCKDNGPICSVCRMQNHEKHVTIPLKIFLSEIQQKIQQKNQNAVNIENFLQQLDQIQNLMLFGLKESVEKMAQEVKQVESNLIESYKKVKERLIAQCFMSENMPKVISSLMNGEINDIDTFRKDCKQLIEITKLNSQSKLDIEINPNKILDDYKISQQDFIKDIQNNTQNLITRLKQVQSILEQACNSGKNLLNVDYKFTAKDKATTITLAPGNKKITQDVNQSQENRFAFIEPILDTTKKSRWAIKIIGLNSWIGLGVALRSKLLEKKFKFDCNNLGHGTYLVSSNGYSWSHSKKEDNVSFKNFHFEKNDTIYIEFDPQAQVINYYKIDNQQTAKFTLSVEIPPKEEVYACVNLCNKNDSVEIVSHKDFNFETQKLI